MKTPGMRYGAMEAAHSTPLVYVRIARGFGVPNIFCKLTIMNKNCGLLIYKITKTSLNKTRCAITIFYEIIETMTAKPNPPIMQPEKRLIHTSTAAEIFSRNRFTPKLKTNHQQADPLNTPKTRSNGSRIVSPCDAKPNPAKIATKERIVAGFDKVKTNVEK